MILLLLQKHRKDGHLNINQLNSPSIESPLLDMWQVIDWLTKTFLLKEPNHESGSKERSNGTKKVSIYGLKKKVEKEMQTKTILQML